MMRLHRRQGPSRERRTQKKIKHGLTFLALGKVDAYQAPAAYILHDFIKESAEIQAIVDKVIICNRKIQKA